MRQNGCRVRAIEVSTVYMRTRIPFQYGIATLTRLPHIFLRVTLEGSDGKVHQGIAAEGLLPKWFEKNPDSTSAEDLRRMWTVIRNAARTALEFPPMPDSFNIWRELYQELERQEIQNNFPPLLWHFGASLVERALVHAVCRRHAVPFHKALRDGLLGFDITAIHPEIPGRFTGKALPRSPLSSVHARHTVGLGDALTADDIDTAVNDGLPETLEDDIARYNLRYFKIKVRGDPTADMERLRRIVSLLRRMNVADYRFSLDGNEQFSSVDSFRAFWDHLQEDKILSPALKHLLFVEQPFSRSVALTRELGRDLLRWETRPPIIIDESDGALEDVQTAIDLGYQGSSYKNCKGVFKGIANRVLLAYRSDHPENQQLIMSGEDLANVGPVALLQDLAVMSALGISHVERNGHHFFRGLSMFSRELQSHIVAMHPDLYAETPAGEAILRIHNGRISMNSINASSFGTELIPEEAPYVDIADWECPTETA